MSLGPIVAEQLPDFRLRIYAWLRSSTWTFSPRISASPTFVGADADRYYRAAFHPRPEQKPSVPLAVLEQQRDALYAENQTTTFRPWADVLTRRTVAA